MRKKEVEDREVECINTSHLSDGHIEVCATQVKFVKHLLSIL